VPRLPISPLPVITRIGRLLGTRRLLSFTLWVRAGSHSLGSGANLDSRKEQVLALSNLLLLSCFFKRP
jgi:hypothetical protein